jgi:putative endonuclease
MRQFFVYILASRPQGTLYIGMTNNLGRRMEEHRCSRVPGCTKRYGVKRLVHLESFEQPTQAIVREKQSSTGIARGRFN